MINFRGLSIITDREVYPPAEDSFLAAEVLEEQIKKRIKPTLTVLDMGTATGILGLFAATRPSVKHVTFADISKDAIRICKENVAFNNAALKAECTVIESDFFSNIEGKFDIITFNAPYLRSDEDDKKLGGIGKAVSGGAEGIEVSIKFLQEASGYLEHNGKIILVASSLSSLWKLRQEISRIGFRITEEKKIHIFFEDIIVMTMIRNL